MKQDFSSHSLTAVRFCLLLSADLQNSCFSAVERNVRICCEWEKEKRKAVCLIIIQPCTQVLCPKEKPIVLFSR